MQLHTLKPKHDTKAKRPRVGRGGKRGTSSGKGTKGQKSRSGHRIRPAMREYIQRLPKLRGYNNKADVNDSALITLSMIEKIGGTVNAEAVVKAGYARKGQAIKVLANGEIKKAVTVEGINVSAGAKTAIEKAGGSVK